MRWRHRLLLAFTALFNFGMAAVLFEFHYVDRIGSTEPFPLRPIWPWLFLFSGVMAAGYLNHFARPWGRWLRALASTSMTLAVGGRVVALLYVQALVPGVQLGGRAWIASVTWMGVLVYSLAVWHWVLFVPSEIDQVRSEIESELELLHTRLREMKDRERRHLRELEAAQRILRGDFAVAGGEEEEGEAGGS